ncbi:hypothetical protein ACQCVP_15195 [Rossellomorea vietnamensis]
MRGYTASTPGIWKMMLLKERLYSINSMDLKGDAVKRAAIQH